MYKLNIISDSLHINAYVAFYNNIVEFPPLRYCYKITDICKVGNYVDIEFLYLLDNSKTTCRFYNTNYLFCYEIPEEVALLLALSR